MQEEKSKILTESELEFLRLWRKLNTQEKAEIRREFEVSE